MFSVLGDCHFIVCIFQVLYQFAHYYIIFDYKLVLELKWLKLLINIHLSK